MTQDEIIEMVMQIGGCDKPEYDSPALKIFESFAKLVAQHERESLRESFRVVTAAEASAAILHEREACAKVADEFAKQVLEHNFSALIAHNIRARGQA